MESTRTLEKKIIRFACIEAVVVILFFLFFFENSYPYILGLIFGLAIGILNFLELSRTLNRAVTLPPEKAQAFATRKYFVRYVIYGVVLWVSIKAPYLHVLGTVLGILLIKGALLFTQLFNDKRYFLNIFKRKEDER